MPTYRHGLIKTLLPELKNIELVIDYIHRLPKPKHLADLIPRDVILSIHFYLTKDQLMQKANTVGTLPEPHANLQLSCGYIATHATLLQATEYYYQSLMQPSNPVPIDTSSQTPGHLSRFQTCHLLSPKCSPATAYLGHHSRPSYLAGTTFNTSSTTLLPSTASMDTRKIQSTLTGTMEHSASHCPSQFTLASGFSQNFLPTPVLLFLQ